MTVMVGSRLCVDALGSRIAADCDDPAVLAVLGDLLGSLTTSQTQACRGFQASAVRDALVRINAEVITQMPYFGVHSAVLAGSDGAIALPGESGSGKSTTTASALLAGLGYVSDEVLALDWDRDELLAQPYPRPLALSGWSCDRLGVADHGPGRYHDSGDETYFRPTILTDRIESAAVGLRHLVLLGPYTECTRLYEVGRQEAATALLTYAFNAWRRPADAFRLAHRIAARTTCWVLERGDPLEIGTVLSSTFGIGPRR